MSNDDKDYNSITKRWVKKCKENQVRNPKSFKCVRKCKDNEKRDLKTFKCVKKDFKLQKKNTNNNTNKDNNPNKCPEGTVLNPKTRRCIKIKKSTNKDNNPDKCPEGTVYNPKTRRCNKIKLQKPCKEGQTRNPKSGRCISIVRLKLKQKIEKEKIEGDYDDESDEAVSFVIHTPNTSDMDCIERSNLTLKDYQSQICRFMDKNRGILVAHGVGSGKTLTAVTVSQCYLDEYENGKVVVATPKSLITNFKKELIAYGVTEKQIEDKYVFFTHTGLSNFVKKEIKLGHFIDKEIDDKKDTINNDEKLLEYFKDCLLIVDEIHNFRTRPIYKIVDGEIQPKNAANAILAAHSSKKVIGLTATPFVNDVTDLKNPLSMITGTKVKSFPKQPRLDDVDEKTMKKFTNELKLKLKKYKSLFSVFYREDTDPDYPKKIIRPTEIKMTKNYHKKYDNIENTLLEQGKVFSSTFLISLRQAVNKIDNESDSPKVVWSINKINNGMKTLVYSQFRDSGVDFIAKKLDEQGISYAVIDGKKTINDRKNIVEQYNTNKLNVLLITKAGGEGLDLKETRQVIILEPVWNEAAEIQIIGRAVRKGSHKNLPSNERNVTVYKLLMVTPNGKKTVDHRISDLILKKKKLAYTTLNLMKSLSMELNQTFAIPASRDAALNEDDEDTDNDEDIDDDEDTDNDEDIDDDKDTDNDED